MLIGVCMPMNDKSSSKIACVIANHYKSTICLRCCENYPFPVTFLLKGYKDLKAK